MDLSIKVGGYIPERDIFRTRRSSSSHRLKTKSKPRSNARSRPSSARTRSSYRRTKRGGMIGMKNNKVHPTHLHTGTLPESKPNSYKHSILKNLQKLGIGTRDNNPYKGYDPSIELKSDSPVSKNVTDYPYQFKHDDVYFDGELKHSIPHNGFYKNGYGEIVYDINNGKATIRKRGSNQSMLRSKQ